ncbi:MAG: phage minor head protein [Gammaproteobacteria bacterium]|nr:phage minor head protein [Gammaproteobacteria bacterium]
MIDKFTTHQILIQRLGNGIYKDITPILKQLRDDINAQLLSRSIPLSQNTQQLLKQLNNIIDNGITQLSDELMNRLNEFAVYEQEFTLKLLDNTTVTTVAIGTGTSAADIASIVATSRIRFPGKKSMTIADLINTFSSAYKDDIKSIIDLGIVNGETTDTIASQIKKLTDTRTIAQARAVVLTATNHAGAMARRAAWQPYHKLFVGERYDAVLDSRTTIICASNDGKVFPFNEGPQPPLHYNSVAKGEMVLTSRGYIKIEDVKIGDFVLTHKGRFKKVLNTMFKKSDNGVIRVMTNNVGLTIKVTDEHPLLCVGKGWVRADEVSVGDELYYNGHNTMNCADGSPCSNITHPKNYPALFNQNIIPYSVGFESVSMPSPITFNSYFKGWNSKVKNSIVYNKLMNIFNPILLKSQLNRHFRWPLLFSLCYGQAIKHFSSYKSIFNRIIFNHSFGVPLIHFVSFFSMAKRPMIFAGIDSQRYISVPYNRGHLRFSKSFNIMYFAPPTHSAISQAKFPFYTSKGFLQSMVMLKNKILAKLLIFKVKHFYTSIVNDINIVAYNDLVFNLEVEEDNSYLVNGVIVHNCRSVRIPELKPEYDLNIESTRASSSGPVSAKLTYPEWLERQNKAVQNEVLGKTRAEAFRKGEIKIEQFINNKGATLTLEQLRKKDLL